MERELRIELGRVWMAAEGVAGLTVGSRIELDSPPGGEAEIHVGLIRFARGEPAVMDGKFCFRVLTVTAAAGRFARAHTAPASTKALESASLVDRRSDN